MMSVHGGLPICSHKLVSIYYIIKLFITSSCLIIHKNCLLIHKISLYFWYGDNDMKKLWLALLIPILLLGCVNKTTNSNSDRKVLNRWENVYYEYDRSECAYLVGYDNPIKEIYVPVENSHVVKARYYIGVHILNSELIETNLDFELIIYNTTI